MRSPLLSPLHRCVDLMLTCDLVEALEKAMAPLTARLQEKGWAVTPQKGLSVQFLAVFGRLRRRSHQRRRDSSPPCSPPPPPPHVGLAIHPHAVWLGPGLYGTSHRRASAPVVIER